MNGNGYVEQIQPRKVAIAGEVANAQQYLVGMEIPAHDYIALTQASTTDTWTYRDGGALGTVVATVVITYTDSNKTTISNVAKT